MSDSFVTFKYSSKTCPGSTTSSTVTGLTLIPMVCASAGAGSAKTAAAKIIKEKKINNFFIIGTLFLRQETGFLGF